MATALAEMVSSSALYRPSVLELAQAGNFRAIAVWLSSLLNPYGITVSASKSRSGRLTLWLNVRQLPATNQINHHWQHRLVRLVCYRLWTLNSAAIHQVRIVARLAGSSQILWQQSVRINTAAVADKMGISRATARRREMPQFIFQLVRSLFVNRVAIAGFFLSYWALYSQISEPKGAEPVVEAPPLNYQSEAEPATPVRNSQSSPLPLSNTFNLQPNQSSQTTLDSRSGPTSTVTAPDFFQGKIVRQVALAHSEKLVALTFDDGPWPETTEKVLEILDQFNIKATFFMVGLHIQNHPEIAKKVADAGHAIGNHTWHHRLNKLDQPTAVEEISNAARLIYEATGVRTQLFRPPGGNLAGELVPYAQQNHYTVTLWSADSQDYFVSAPLIVDNVLKEVQPGGIVLLHDGGGDRMATVQALPQIITALKRQGYQFVTVPQLLEIKARQEQRLATKRTQV